MSTVHVCPTTEVSVEKISRADIYESSVFGIFPSHIYNIIHQYLLVLRFYIAYKHDLNHHFVSFFFSLLSKWTSGTRIHSKSHLIIFKYSTKDEWSNWNFPDTSHFIHVIKKNRGITQNQKYLNVGHNIVIYNALTGMFSFVQDYEC